MLPSLALGTGRWVAIEEALVRRGLQIAVGRQRRADGAVLRLDRQQASLLVHDRFDGRELLDRLGAARVDAAAQQNAEVLEDAHGDAAHERRELFRLGVQHGDVALTHGRQEIERAAAGAAAAPRVAVAQQIVALHRCLLLRSRLAVVPPPVAPVPRGSDRRPAAAADRAWAATPLVCARPRAPAVVAVQLAASVRFAAWARRDARLWPPSPPPAAELASHPGRPPRARRDAPSLPSPCCCGRSGSGFSRAPSPHPRPAD